MKNINIFYKEKVGMMNCYQEICALDEKGRIKLPFLLAKKQHLDPFTPLSFDYGNDYVTLCKASESVYTHPSVTSRMVRKLDRNRRISIPKSLQLLYNIGPGDYVEIYAMNSVNILRKKESTYRHIDVSSIAAESRQIDSFYTELRNGKLYLSNPILQKTGITPRSELQFFLKGHTLIIKKYQLKINSSKDIVYTGRSTILDQNGWLNIPKKIRKHLSLEGTSIVRIHGEKDKLSVHKLF
ncbi:AbrB/MazE/SpoVT family DNA-binding domain-containing protein [Priestia megaterium]